MAARQPNPEYRVLDSPTNYDRIVAANPDVADQAENEIFDALCVARDPASAAAVLQLHEAGVRRANSQVIDMPGSNPDKTNLNVSVNTGWGVKKVLGGFVAGTVLTAGGILGFEAYNGFNLNLPPVFSGKKSVQVENSTLEAYINIDELCFAQVAGKSGAIAKFQGKALGIDIPGAWMSESLNENMSERICVDTKKTSLVWSNGGKGVKVTIAPGGIVTDTAIDTIIDGQSDRGATMATSEALAIFWSVVSNDGLPATIDGARTQLRNLAQLQTAENFVASCGPTAWKQFAGKRSTVGLQNIIMKFNPAVQKVDVTLPSTPPSFHSETAYPALQALHAKDNQNKNVDFSFDGKNVGTCTVPANVPVTDKAHNVWVPNRG